MIPDTENEARPSPKLGEYLQTLQPTPPRQPQAAAAARSSFLKEASQFSPGVSKTMHERLNEWKETLKQYWYFSRKEKKFMFNIIMSVLIVLGVAFGGGTATVAAAQGALPDEFLYPIKTLSEDVRLGLVSDPENKFDLALAFAARRAEEIQTMLMNDGEVTEPIMLQFESQQQFALQMAANLPDDQVNAALLKLQEQTQQQQQTMAQLQIDDPLAEQVRSQVQTMLMAMEQMAQQGGEDPTWLREQLRQQEQVHLTATPTDEVVEESEEIEADPGNGNPWTDEEPTPYSSYGPGESQNPWTDEEPTPDSSYGPGESQNPWTDEVPTPGSGYGPGECDETDCVPQNNSEDNLQATPSPNQQGQQDTDSGESPGNNNGNGNNH